MRARLVAVLLVLAAAAAVPAGAQSRLPVDPVARLLRNSGPHACIARLRVVAVLPVGHASLPGPRRNTAVWLGVEPLGVRPGPNNRTAGACAGEGPAPGPTEAEIIFPGDVVPTLMPLTMEVLVDGVRGVPTADGQPIVLLTFLRRL